MTDNNITVSQVLKLGHRIKEVRERSLLSLISKLKYGYGFEEDFNGTKELIFNLIEWFQFDTPTYQEEVLQLLSNVLQTPSGQRVARSIGYEVVLNKLITLKHKIDPIYTKLLEKIIRFIEINTETLNIPKLNMPFSQRSENILVSSYDSTEMLSIQNDKDKFSRNVKSSDEQNQDLIFDLSFIGIKLYLMPWIDLCDSDKKKLKLNEDCICKDNSKERAIYFFQHVLLKDFVPDVFLNRATTIKTFQILMDDEKFGVLSMEALSSFCDSIILRIKHLSDSSLKYCKRLCVDEYDSRRSRNREEILTAKSGNSKISNIELSTMLNQLPLPIFCFDTMLIVVSLLNRKISESLQKHNISSFSVTEMNAAFSLNNKLFKILSRIITSNLWKSQDTNKFKQEIIQKIIQLLHLCGDVLNKSKIHTSTLDRMCHLNMLTFCIHFADWCDYTPILPRAFVSNLFDCLDDISFACIYPKYHDKLFNFLQFQQYGNIEDQHKLKMHMDMKEIAESMNYAIKVIQSFDEINKSSDIIEIVKNSLNSLEFHKNVQFIKNVLNIFSKKLPMWDLNEHHWNDVRHVTLYLLAHNCAWIQEEFYMGIDDIGKAVLSGLIKTDESEYDETSLKFIIDPKILTEICTFGIESKSHKVSTCAKNILQYLLRGKLLVTDSMWKLILEAILPVLPILQTHAEHKDDFGKAIVKTVDLKIGERMLIPKIELIKGNVRLLFSKCLTVQMEGSKNLVKFIHFQEDGENMLPKSDCIRADVLCSILRSTCVNLKNFNVNKPKDSDFYEEGALMQVINLLKSSINREKDEVRVDPSICKSALSQLAVMMQQINLHDLFYSNMGCSIVKHFLRSSLVSSEYTTFPESALSCISILNSLCYSNTSMRHWASEDQNILLYIIRTIFLFPNEENYLIMASQLLGLLSFSHFIVNSDKSDDQDENWTDNLSLHHTIVSKMNLPFKCVPHSKFSSYTFENKEELMMKQKSIGTYLRIHWNVHWYGSLGNILKWPYVPEDTDDPFDISLMMTKNDLSLLKATSGIESCILALYQIQNASSYKSVEIGFGALIGYIKLALNTDTDIKELCKLSWCSTLRRFMSTSPAGFKDLSLLFNLTNFLNAYLKLFQNGYGDFIDVSWIIDSILEIPYGICSFLKKSNEDIIDNESNLISYKIRCNLLKIISVCCKLCRLKDYETETKEISWNNVICYVNDCLSDLSINSMNSLAYAGQIVECLMHLMNSVKYDDDQSELQKIVENLINICESLFVKNDNDSFKGYSIILNSLMIFSRLSVPGNIKCWIDENNSNILSMCLLWQNSNHLLLKSLSLKIMSGIISCRYQSEKRYSTVEKDLIRYAVDILGDAKNACLLREQAAVFLSNFLSTKRNFQKDNFDDECVFMMLTLDFFNRLTDTLSNIILNETDEIDLGENIPLNYLMQKEENEVAISKRKLNNIEIKINGNYTSKCTIGLAISISNVIYNILLLFDEKIPDVMLMCDVFRTLFRCLILKIPFVENKFLMYTAVCRVLYKASDVSEEVLDVLLNNHDCINGLLEAFVENFRDNQEIDIVSKHVEMWKWSFLLLGSLIDNPRGYKCVCEYFNDVGSSRLFESILITISDIRYKDIISSSLYCLVSLLNSYTSYYSDIDIALENVFDTTMMHKKHTSGSVKTLETASGKRSKNKKIMGEEFCFNLLELYCKYNVGTIEKRMHDDEFNCTASALCNVIGISGKAKIFAVNHKFVEFLLDNLNDIQNDLMMSTKSHSSIKNKKAPVIHYLNWTILLLCNLISNCDIAKSICVDFNLVSPIIKLWPWILSNEMLRFHTIQMISSYTNCYPKACNTMCIIVGTSSLLSDIIGLLVKEMNLVTRTHSLVTLEGCLIVLKNVSSHAHCRNIILKSEIFSCLNKIHPAITKRQPQWKKVEVMWDNFCTALSTYSDAQIKIAEHFDVICALICQADGIMLNVLRNCAFNSLNRPRYLGSADIIHIFSNILTSECSIDDKTDVCIALWALCANNHKSKLSLKMANITAKLSDCLHRIKRTSQDTNHNDAIQIMTYVLNMMKST